MDTSGTIWAGLNKNNFLNQTYWIHLGHFESDSVTAITKNQNKN